jgi:hypothetical protein
LRIIGPAVLVPTVLPPLAGALLVALLHSSGRSSSIVDGVAGLVLEGVCPLGPAVAVLMLVGRDRGVELVLATPARYGRVLFARAGIVAGLGAVTSLLVAVALYCTGTWPAQESGAGIVLAWAAPLVWLGGLGLLAAVASASAGVGSALVGGLWLAEILGTDTFTGNPALRSQYLYTTHIHLAGGAWVANRVALIVVGIAAIAAARPLLASPARLIAQDAS